jgi:hypothetical protein
MSRSSEPLHQPVVQTLEIVRGQGEMAVVVAQQRLDARDVPLQTREPP